MQVAGYAGAIAGRNPGVAEFPLFPSGSRAAPEVPTLYGALASRRPNPFECRPLPG